MYLIEFGLCIHVDYLQVYAMDYCYQFLFLSINVLYKSLYTHNLT